MRVALIGAGVMGGAIGTRLLAQGVGLTVFDLDKERVAALAALGAKVASSAAMAGSEADFVILSLNSAVIVERAMFGSDGVSQKAKAGTLIIDMSSIDPQSTRDFAEQAGSSEIGWLDCPLSGGAPKALTGNLAVMAGGRSEDFERARPLMNLLCANFTHMGPSGAGQTTKLINQVLCALNFLAVAEATKLAEDAGVTAARIPDAIKGGRADSAILQEFMIKMANRDYTPTGRIDNMIKDMNGVQDLARQTGTPMPLTAVCAEIHRQLAARGMGDADNAALMEFFS